MSPGPGPIWEGALKECESDAEKGPQEEEELPDEISAGEEELPDRMLAPGQVLEPVRPHEPDPARLASSSPLTNMLGAEKRPFLQREPAAEG